MEVSRRAFLATAGAVTAGALVPGRLLAAVQKHTPTTPDLSNWAAVKALFPLAKDKAQFAGFFIASHPKPVSDAIQAFRRAIDESPFLQVEHRMFESETANALLEVCRAAAPYMGAKPEEIALTQNTTTGLALVYHGLPLKPGDEILVTEHDHYSHHEAVRTAALRSGATTRRVALYEDASKVTSDDVVARIEKAIRPETRVLGMTWVHSSTGVRLPIRAISFLVGQVNATRDANKQLLLVVDGVHGFGCLDDSAAELGADFFSAGTHKWMFAPRGTGVLWGRADRWPLLQPTIPSFATLTGYEAWLKGESPPPTDAAMVSPGGFQAYEHQWAMTAAFAMHAKLGRARVATRIRALNDQIKQGLAAMKQVHVHTPMAADVSAGIVAFEVAGLKPEQVVAKLLEKNIVASTSPYRVTYARLSAGLINDEQEIETALRAVRGLAGA
ncbi:MAG TPA: aminotransferase class V-fold PLP-dependent enzyme [Methylomirabilota bacterium]|jgi:selenocysteine lyase/cysteine desulfurase|nr:aminotransferase class V-fold PLP-dependent enzyme [Methylomirabilota bacterium]